MTRVERDASPDELSAEERRLLLRTARRSIEARLRGVDFEPARGARGARREAWRLRHAPAPRGRRAARLRRPDAVGSLARRDRQRDGRRGGHGGRALRAGHARGAARPRDRDLGARPAAPDPARGRGGGPARPADQPRGGAAVCCCRRCRSSTAGTARPSSSTPAGRRGCPEDAWRDPAAELLAFTATVFGEDEELAGGPQIRAPPATSIT